MVFFTLLEKIGFLSSFQSYKTTLYAKNLLYTQKKAKCNTSTETLTKQNRILGFVYG